jgi:predicted O-methyltransferase YrrM
MWPELDIEHIVANGFAIGMIQADAEALEWAAFVRDVIEAEVIVELGTLCGGNMYIMDRMSPPGLRISVDREWSLRDPKPCWPPDLLNEVLPELVWITGDIHAEDTLSRMQEALCNRKIDLLYVDADHSYIGTKRHVEMYGPMVKQGGYIAFHDLVNGWPCGQYVQTQLFPRYEHWVIKSDVSPFGVGVIRI